MEKATKATVEKKEEDNTGGKPPMHGEGWRMFEPLRGVTPAIDTLFDGVEKSLRRSGFITKDGKLVSERSIQRKLNSIFTTESEREYIDFLRYKQEKRIKEKLHKQPRNYLKTMARLVGKSTNEPSLFDIPETSLAIPETGAAPVVALRETISKNTAILGNYLLQEYQNNGGNDLVITNLSTISEMMGNSNYEIKIYLLYLGGYVYPIIDKDKSGGMTLTTEQLFHIKFKYSPAVAAKYKEGITPEVGGGLMSFIKDEPIESIVIKPNQIFVKALEGKGLGNVPVTDGFIKLALSLTDIAFKILSYSSSNKPNQKIAEGNLIRHLGLERQIKTQGKPRVRETILRGLQELKDNEHIKNYSYNKETEMYVFNYSDKYILHRDLGAKK